MQDFYKQKSHSALREEGKRDKKREENDVYDLQNIMGKKNQTKPRENKQKKDDLIEFFSSAGEQLEALSLKVWVSSRQSEEKETPTGTYRGARPWNALYHFKINPSTIS